MTSIHSSENAEIHEMPMSVLIRPFPPEVNDEKVKSLMRTLQDPETESLVPPVDVLWIQGSEGNLKLFFFISNLSVLHFTSMSMILYMKNSIIG